MMKRLHSTLIALFIILLPLVPRAAPASAAQASADYPIPGGHFFTQAAGGQGGFSVIDDGRARFWTEFQRLGGLDNVGYPISRRFVYDGFVTQAFQKLVLQWRPEVNQAWPMNVFDELSDNGFDPTLLHVRQTPQPLANFDAPGASWNDIVGARWRLLDANPAIRQRYFSLGDPLNIFGLPTSRVEDMGNHFALRTQRAVFQQWKEDVPWASKGQVTVANGGDIGKEMGWLTGDMLRPELLPGTPTVTEALEVKSLVVSSTPGRLYALASPPLSSTTPPPVNEIYVSDDWGDSWRDFPTPDCAGGLDLDTRSDTLYAASCSGLHVWTGNVWMPTGASGHVFYDTAFDPERSLHWWVALGSDGLRYTDNGGRSLQPLSEAGYAYEVEVDPRDHDVLYTLSWNRNTPPFVRRQDANGTWADLPLPEGHYLNSGLLLDPAIGDLYVVTDPAAGSAALWHSSNPRVADPAAVQWERVFKWVSDEADLLAIGRRGDEVVLFANVRQPGTVLPLLHRSADGGQSWHALDLR